MLRVQTGKPSYMIKTTEIGINEFAVPPFDPIITLPKGDAYIRYNNMFKEYEYVDINSLMTYGW